MNENANLEKLEEELVEETAQKQKKKPHKVSGRSVFEIKKQIQKKAEKENRGED